MIHGKETVVIERKSAIGEDDWGNPVNTVSQVTVEGCLFGWGGTNTNFGINRDITSSSATLYMPKGTVVLDGDLFIVRNERYRKDGESQVWETPVGFSLNTGVVVAIKRAEG